MPPENSRKFVLTARRLSTALKLKKIQTGSSIKASTINRSCTVRFIKIPKASLRLRTKKPGSAELSKSIGLSYDSSGDCGELLFVSHQYWFRYWIISADNFSTGTQIFINRREHLWRTISKTLERGGDFSPWLRWHWPPSSPLIPCSPCWLLPPSPSCASRRHVPRTHPPPQSSCRPQRPAPQLCNTNNYFFIRIITDDTWGYKKKPRLRSRFYLDIKQKFVFSIT